MNSQSTITSNRKSHTLDVFRSERGSLATDVRPFLNHLYHSFICVMPILFSTKAFCIISIVSVQLLPKLKQNFMQILRATQGVRSVTTAFREFVRDYWLRSHPAEANRTLWREDINAGRIFFGLTSYISGKKRNFESCDIRLG